jgi:hypothetical protein
MKAPTKIQLELAEKLHEYYELVSKSNGWITQKKCQVKFDDLPDKNRKVMYNLASFVEAICNAGVRAERKRIKEEIEERLNAEEIYPKDIFPELDKESLYSISELLNKTLSITLDRLSAHIMRIARNELIKEVIKILEEKK